jgi:hypothetical protein
MKLAKGWGTHSFSVGPGWAARQLSVSTAPEVRSQIFTYSAHGTMFG